MTDAIDASYRVEGGMWSHDAPAVLRPPNPWELLGQQIAEGIAAVVTEGVRTIKAAMDGLAVELVRAGQRLAAEREARVPDSAIMVRPVGGRSNSRDWLAWDVDRWRPCYRRAGTWYWA